MKLKIVISILAFKCCFCHAQIEQIYKELSLHKDSIESRFLISKRIYKSQKIYAIPVVTEREEDSWTGNLTIVKFDTITNKILAKTTFENILNSDAIEIKEMWIDTAPYILKNGVRAFGVRIRSANNSRAASAEMEDIILIKEDNGRFYKILETTTKRSVFYGGGNCEENEGFTITSTLTIDKNNITNGHYNIVEKLESDTYTLTKECEEVETQTKKFTNVFHFENGEYKCKHRQTGD